jgi:hypothetical protein
VEPVRPLVLLRLALRLQDRRGWRLPACLALLAPAAEVDRAMRRLLQ